MRKIVLFLLITCSLSVWAQGVAPKKYNYNDFSLIVGAEDQEKYYNELLKETPLDPAKPTMHNDYRAKLAVSWFAKGNIERFNYYMKTNPRFPPIDLIDFVYALEYAVDNDKNIPLVEQVSKELLDKIEKRTQSDGLSRTQILLEVNALANAKLGNLDIAKKNIEQSGTVKDTSREIKYFKDSKANYLARYSYILSAAGEHKRALDTLIKAFHNADSNPKMVGVFREIYKKVHGNDKGADKLIKSLQKEAYEKYYKEVEKLYVAAPTKTITGTFPDPSGNGKTLTSFQAKTPIKDISVTNLDNKSVKLADYAGKILVVDFWTTACTPCVAAFAGFEKVVADFKKDQLQLFVVNIFEQLPTIKSFVAKRGITLDVVSDEPNAGFNIAATPSKIIYDPMGNIRFFSTGYAGSTDREYYKLKAMVEITMSHASDKSTAGSR
jgi:peroxiredoxin